MRRLSWLDSLVYGFQHRWETNPQYRAAVSGVVGLLTILMLCACLGVLTTVANATLAGFGAGSSGGVLVSTDTGTGKLAAGQKFPTATPPTLPAGALAAGAIPNSQTPKPGPTEAPTPTDTPTAAGVAEAGVATLAPYQAAPARHPGCMGRRASFMRTPVRVTWESRSSCNTPTA